MACQEPKPIDRFTVVVHCPVDYYLVPPQTLCLVSGYQGLVCLDWYGGSTLKVLHMFGISTALIVRGFNTVGMWL